MIFGGEEYFISDQAHLMEHACVHSLLCEIITHSHVIIVTHMAHAYVRICMYARTHTGATLTSFLGKGRGAEYWNEGGGGGKCPSL